MACLAITTLYVYKNLLWIGTSAGIILYLNMSKLENEFNENSIELECLSYGHIGPVKYFLSNKSRQINHFRSSFLISVGYGFEQFNYQNIHYLTNADSLFHLIFWNLNV